MCKIFMRKISKPLMSEIKELNKCKGYSMFTNKKTQYCLDVRPHLIDRLGSTPIKIPASYFVVIDKVEKAKDSK